MHKTLITPSVLASHLNDPSWVVIDCRFDLANPSKGEELYRAGHIPGARYAHLDRQLSGEKTGTNGRHPLPEPEAIVKNFGELGIAPHCQVIAYDGDNGMYAARLWWMLRWMGHDSVAVLDGGLARWQSEGHKLRSGAETTAAVTFKGSPRRDWRLTVDQVAAELGSATRLLVDARTNERYHGVGETLDKVGGHIPGAANYFFGQNLAEDRTFKPVAELRKQWNEVLAGHDAKDVVMYCGSGVTACHNLLALEHAGIHGARIFPGSWSEWSADPKRPVETK